MQNPGAAVVVNKAIKGYGAAPIVNELNMNVQAGTIYGLLGSSGCGKTTMLNCIVGLKKLDSGSIQVFGREPTPGAKIGYMPQDIALFQKFTIKEILAYFGRIYGMSKIQIQARTEFLASFLQLPDTNRLIQTLSGGQARRTSLAVSMVHQPPLLILDEPTVGVDPILRQNIWNHLIEMTRMGTTVIITTHYIEEARQSHMIGLMRSGRLLTENNPENLLNEYNTDLLEDIVLKLCKNDQMIGSNDFSPNSSPSINVKSTPFNKPLKKIESETPTAGHNNVVVTKYKTRSPDYNTVKINIQSTPCSYQQPQYFASRFKRITSVIKANSLSVYRHPVFTLMQVFLPAFQLLIFNLTLGRDPTNLKFGVVNHEFPTYNFPQYCSNRTDVCFADGLSCNYLNLFNDGTVNWIPMASEAEALRNVENGQFVGYLSFPENFTAHTKDKFLLRNFAENDTLLGSTISTRMDLSNQMTSSFLTKLLFQKYLQFLQNIANQCGEDPRAVTLPLQFKNAFSGTDKLTAESVNIKWTEFFQPSFLIWIIFLVPMGCSILMTTDARDGLFQRTMIAGVTFPEFVIARTIYDGVVIAVQLIICVSILTFIFDLSVKGSMLLFLFYVLMVGLTGLSFGILFGTTLGHPMEAIMIILFLYTIIIPLSGGAWPIAAVSPWMRYISYILPVTIPMEALRSIVSRGWGLSHPLLWQGLGILLAWTVFNYLISAYVHKTRK